MLRSDLQDLHLRHILFSGIRKLFSFAFPVTAGIMLCGITFDVADGHCLADFFSFALQLTCMAAHMSQCVRERYFLTDNRYGCIIIALFYKTDVTRDISMGRTGGTARNQCLFFFQVRCQKLYLSRMEPVGQTSAQAVQKRQSSSFSNLPCKVLHRSQDLFYYTVIRLHLSACCRHVHNVRTVHNGSYRG